MSVEDDGREAEDVSLGASVSVPPLWNLSKLRGWPIAVLSYPSGHKPLYKKVQDVFTLICMRYLCVSVIHRTMARTTGSLTYRLAADQQPDSIQNSSHLLPHYLWYSSSIPLRVVCGCVCMCGSGMFICFVSVLGSHEMGRHKYYYYQTECLCLPPTYQRMTSNWMFMLAATYQRMTSYWMVMLASHIPEDDVILNVYVMPCWTLLSAWNTGSTH